MIASVKARSMVVLLLLAGVMAVAAPVAFEAEGNARGACRPRLGVPRCSKHRPAALHSRARLDGEWDVGIHRADPRGQLREPAAGGLHTQRQSAGSLSGRHPRPMSTPSASWRSSSRPVGNPSTVRH